MTENVRMRFANLFLSHRWNQKSASKILQKKLKTALKMNPNPGWSSGPVNGAWRVVWIKEVPEVAELENGSSSAAPAITPEIGFSLPAENVEDTHFIYSETRLGQTLPLHSIHLHWSHSQGYVSFLNWGYWDEKNSWAPSWLPAPPENSCCC